MINNKNLFDELFDEPEPEDHGIRNSHREYVSNNSKSSFQVEISKKFKEWEQQLISAPGYPNNKESRLAIETLKVCITESTIDEDIAKNAYALFDYTMFCYFVFRAHLCADFPRNFVELYDTYIQNLISTYFSYHFDIPQERISRFIFQRAQNYESVVREENAVYELTAMLTNYIEKDLEDMPGYGGILITSFTDNFELHIKLSDSVSATLNALNLLIVSTQSAKVQSSYEPPNQEPILNHYANKHDSAKESKNKQEEEEISEKRSFMSKTKERFFYVFGSLGAVLYFVLTLFVSVLPFVMIDANFFVTLLLISVEMAFPLTSVAFWIWGLICAINGPQDWVAISYYIAFTVLWLPFYISVFLAFFKKRQ